MASDRVFGARYLGSSPTEHCNGSALAPASSLLKIKLQRLQARAVQMQVERKYGPQPFSSPKFGLVAKKMKRAGKDVTKGDRVDVRGKGDELQVRAKGEAHWLRFHGSEVLECAVVTPGAGKKRTATVAFLTSGDEENLCHVLMCYPNEAKAVEKIILDVKHEAHRQASAKSVRKSAARPRSSQLAGTKDRGDETSITFGVGLTRVSSMRVTKSTRQRLNTVSLTGNKRDKVKRASDSYGSTFRSMDGPGESSADVPDRFSFVDRQASDRSIMSDASDVSVVDDDLDGLDESLFTTTDHFDAQDLETDGDQGFVYAPKDPTMYGFAQVFGEAQEETFGFPEDV
eukprot:m.117072 g.117072  ORF g.117072 m.117072 type:complete len:343 (+) comp16392_c0_seq5:809-1837(+)